MKTDRRSLLATALAGVALPAIARTKSSRGPETLRLWPAGAPGGQGVTVVEKSVVVDDQGRPGRDISGVRDPLISLHRPSEAFDTAVLVIAGGAFRRVTFDKEGEEVCAWLAGQGVAAGALLYRLPGDGWAEGPDATLHDAVRGLRLLARQTGARRLGVLGFSAGGTIAGAMATRLAELNYTPVDDVDSQAVRIDFLGLGYPYLNVPAPPKPIFFDGLTASAPPTFFFHAADDPRVSVDNSIEPFRALKRLGVPAALHVFESGGHGFALRAPSNSSAAAWPGLFLTWLRASGAAAA